MGWPPLHNQLEFAKPTAFTPPPSALTAPLTQSPSSLIYSFIHSPHIYQILLCAKYYAKSLSNTVEIQSSEEKGKQEEIPILVELPLS